MQDRFRHWIKRENVIATFYFTNLTFSCNSDLFSCNFDLTCRRLSFSELWDIKSHLWEIMSELRDVNLQLRVKSKLWVINSQPWQYISLFVSPQNWTLYVAIAIYIPQFYFISHNSDFNSQLWVSHISETKVTIASFFEEKMSNCNKSHNYIFFIFYWVAETCFHKIITFVKVFYFLLKVCSQNIRDKFQSGRVPLCWPLMFHHMPSLDSRAPQHTARTLQHFQCGER